MRVKFPATNSAENRRRKREAKCFYHFDNYRNPESDRYRHGQKGSFALAYPLSRRGFDSGAGGV
jgi:hypothetical protein